MYACLPGRYNDDVGQVDLARTYVQDILPRLAWPNVPPVHRESIKRKMGRKLATIARLEHTITLLDRTQVVRATNALLDTSQSCQGRPHVSRRDWQYNSDTGQTSCYRCTGAKVAASISCDGYKEGRYGPDSGNCKDCPKGFYANGAGFTSCSECLKGEYADKVNSTECELCLAESIASFKGNFQYNL